jgi:DNA-binding transcriptional regulator YiaG
VTGAKRPEPSGEGSFSKDDEVVAVGSTIRALRTERGLSLRELSRRTGLSTGFLSMVERGQSSLALTSLNNVKGH